jgi:hypothetical protein
VGLIRTSTWTLRYTCSTSALFHEAIPGVTIWWAIYAWNAVDVEMSVHGYIAMILGIVFSLVIGCGLMALMF